MGTDAGGGRGRLPGTPGAGQAQGLPGSPGNGQAQALPVPGTEQGRAGLAALLAAPGAGLIALDFDGTLAPIVPDPADARALPEAVTALRALAPLVGTLAVITGRPALTALEYGLLDLVPGLIVLGHYGRQRWQDGELTAPPPPPGLEVARRELPGVLAAAGAPADTWIEDKTDALAVHTRRSADPVAAVEAIRAPLLALAAKTGLQAEPGRLVIELRPPGSDKGQALTSLISERGPAAVLFCGDDLGDKPAFEAIARLRRSGLAGLAVCSGSAEVSELAGLADLIVDGPEGVAGLLAGLVAAIAG